jgi:hypothetical protein
MKWKHNNGGIVYTDDTNRKHDEGIDEAVIYFKLKNSLSNYNLNNSRRKLGY